MSTSNFKEYLVKVMSKVKSKEAHPMIEKELANHYQMLSETLQTDGQSKEEAGKKAIKEMGNPFTLGENLNRIHKPKMDWLLVVLFIVIAGISFLPIMNGVQEFPGDTAFFIGRQILGYAIALLVITFFLFFDYRKLMNLWVYFYGFALLLLLYTELFGRIVYNAKNWISLFGFSIDTSIVTLLLLFLAWAGIFSKINEFSSWKKQLVLLFLFWFPLSYYITIPNISLLIMYFITVVMMFLFSQVNKKLATQLVVVNLIAIVIFALYFITFRVDEFFIQRLLVFINPAIEPNGSGYWYFLLQDILLEAGWFGNGLDNAPAFPSIHTEFAFLFLVYTLGWAFGIILCLILLTFITRISINAFKTKDLYGRLVVIGGAVLFAVPTCWNILMILGLLPITGMSLPFISYGNTILVVYSIILGLILSVYRRKDLVEPTINNVKRTI